MSKSLGKIGKKYKKGERFSIKKLAKGFNIFSPIWLAKALSDTFKVVFVCLLIFGLTFGIGYFKGQQQKPVLLGYRDFRAYVIDDSGKKHKIQVKNNILYFNKAMVRVKDVPGLKEFGINIRPKMFFGVGSEGIEPGIGIQTAYYRKFSLDLFGTIKKAVYIGISREIEYKNIIQNSSVGIAIGTKISKLLEENKKDIRFLLYYSIKF